MSNKSLEASDAISAAGAVAPRVSLASMEDKISNVFFFTAGEAIHGAQIIREGRGAKSSLPLPVELLTICVIVLKNGWTLLGKSAPASPENFDADKGKHFAREDALRQLWPFEGYLLRERLASEDSASKIMAGSQALTDMKISSIVGDLQRAEFEPLSYDPTDMSFRNAKGDKVPDNEVVRHPQHGAIRMTTDTPLGESAAGKLIGRDRAEEGDPPFKG